MTDEHALDEGMIDMAQELEAAGLITTGVDSEGNETWSLTPLGTRVATQLAMSSEDDAAAMLSKLLDASASEE